MEPTRTPHPPAPAFITTSEAGERMQGPVGGPLRFLARANATAGNATVFENLVAPGAGPPLHAHDVETESWYVLSGSFRFRLSDEVVAAPAGSYVFVPPGVAHCFENIGDEPGTILVTFTPAGMEEFFESFAQITPEDATIDAFTTIGARSGMTILGPGLRISHPH